MSILFNQIFMYQWRNAANIYIYIQKSWTFTKDMELSPLRQKRQNRTTCNLARFFQCIWFSSAPLNPDGPRLFQLPWQGWGNHNEILQFSLMQFTVKGDTTKWQALEIGIMMDCVISQVLLVWLWNSYYEVQQIRRKKRWLMNIWLFLLLDLLWMTSPFGGCNTLQNRYRWLNTKALWPFHMGENEG